MIKACILGTDNVISETKGLISELPFGDAEKRRLLSVKNEKKALEGLGAMLALSCALKRLGSGDRFEIVRDENGKPYFAERGAPSFSISHSNGICVAAVSDTERALGVDVELIRDVRGLSAIAERYFNDEERRIFRADGMSAETFFKLWTAKEALAKLDGAGLSAVVSGKRTAADLGAETATLTVRLSERTASLSVCTYGAVSPIDIFSEGEDLEIL